MAGIKSFIDKVKEKNTEFKAKQNEKMAQSKGFSSYDSFNFYTGEAKTEGEEHGKTQLRKKTLKQVRDQAEEDVLLGRAGKYGRFQKKVARGFDSFQKGAGIYNEVMGGLKSFNSGDDLFFPRENSSQAYASGYGLYNPNKSRRKSKPKAKPKRRSKPRKNTSFWSQYY